MTDAHGFHLDSIVVADLNSKLENFGGANLTDVLKTFDTNAGAALGK